MADGLLKQAIYALRYDTGDSVTKLRETRLAAEQAAAAGEKLAASEENTSRSTLRLLAALDPRIKAEQQAAQQLERINRLHAEGAATSQQYAQAVTLIERNSLQANAALEAKRSVLGRIDASVGGLVARYLSWSAAIVAVQRLVHETIRTNDEAAASVDRMGEAYTRLAQNAGPAVSFLTDLMTGLLDRTNNVVEGLGKAFEEIRRSPLLGGQGSRSQSGIWPGAGRSSRLDAGGNWIPGAESFPESGVTDLTAIAAAEKKLADERQKQFNIEADRIHKLSEAREEMYAKWRESEDKRHAEFAKNLGDELKRLSQFGIERDRIEADALEKALEYGEELAKAERKRLEQFADDQKRALERQAEETQRYWENVTLALTDSFQDFWQQWAQTGELNFRDLFAKLKAWFAQLLWDMIIMARLRPIALNIVGALGGQAGGAASALGAGAGLGGASGGILGSLGLSTAPGSFGGALGGGLFGAGVGSITGMIGGNSTGGALGGGIGGAIGSIWGPIGTLVGSALGGLVGGLFKGGKPSDMRSVATFGSDGTFNVAAQSAHESSQQTLGMAQQAAASISQQIQELTAFGVDFTAKLSNIWIGQRDASSFQLAGGQRVSVGTVGDVADLTADTIAALIKSATSADPEIAAVLKSGGTAQAIMQSITALNAARAFSSEIEQALLQIQDPLKATIEIWKKESQARLDMAAQLGVSLDKVKELNAAIYQQMVAQQNAPAIASLGQFVQSLQFGPGSAASPQSQYTSAFSAYDAARQAALANPTAQSAAAFQQSAQAFLPIAREYYGTTATYQSFVTGTINTAQQLQGALGAPPAMPDLTPLITTTAAASAANVEELQALKAEVKGLREDNQTLIAQLASLFRQFAPA